MTTSNVIQCANIPAGEVLGACTLLEDMGTVGDGVQFGTIATIGNVCKIGNRVLFGNYSILGHTNVIGDSVHFGDLCDIGATNTFGDQCTFGQGCAFGPHTTVGDDVVIGSNAELGVGFKHGLRLTLEGVRVLTVNAIQLTYGDVDHRIQVIHHTNGVLVRAGKHLLVPMDEFLAHHVSDMILKVVVKSITDSGHDDIRKHNITGGW